MLSFFNRNRSDSSTISSDDRFSESSDDSDSLPRACLFADTLRDHQIDRAEWPNYVHQYHAARQLADDFSVAESILEKIDLSNCYPAEYTIDLMMHQGDIKAVAVVFTFPVSEFDDRLKCAVQWLLSLDPGKGFAKKLMQQILYRTQQSGCVHASVQATAQAMPLYQSLQFQSVFAEKYIDLDSPRARSDSAESDYMENIDDPHAFESFGKLTAMKVSSDCISQPITHDPELIYRVCKPGHPNHDADQIVLHELTLLLHEYCQRYRKQFLQKKHALISEIKTAQPCIK